MIGQRADSASPPVPEILVGTDGSTAAATAVEYALRLAEATGAPVRIVHVVPSHRLIPPQLAENVLEAGRELLFDVVRRAQFSAPRVPISSALLTGPKRAQFVAAAHGAGMVVLGRSGHLGSLATGSTAAAVVESTDCPVRIVPPDWRTRTNQSEVVVAVKDIAASGDLIRRGFEIAQDLEETLVLLHAWGLPSGYEDVVSLDAAETWNQQLAKRIENEAASLHSEYPEVTFQVRIEHARTATALASASRRASFLLLGRSSHHRAVGHRTGLTHMLVNVCECPLEVGVEPRLPSPLLNLALEEDGHLLR